MAYNFNQTKFGAGSFNSRFKNPYQFGAGRVSEDMSSSITDAIKKRNEIEEYKLKEERSGLDRTFDALQVGNYTTANYASDWVKFVKGEEGSSFGNAINPLDDIESGLRASNPFGEGSEEDEKNYSDVLGEAGWNPTSGAGRFAKGTLGFVGDVLLDPTTYLTGGVSAVIKGTGRTGKVTEQLGKIAQEASKAGGDNAYESFIKKGVNEKTAQEEAYRVEESISAKFKNAKSLTPDIAREIVLKRHSEREMFAKENGQTYLKPTASQIEKDASELSRKFNSAVGIRDVDGKGGITLGVENLPFGDKLAPKLGVLGKSIKLSDGDTIRKMSDSIGISTAYSNMRAHVYGSKLGKLFSASTSPLKGLADEDPAKLYDFLSSVNYAKGLNLDKLGEEKQIREIASSMNFTPSQSKEIIALMEDKTVMAKVAGTLKFANTKNAMEMRKMVETDKAGVEKELATRTKVKELTSEIEKLSKAGGAKARLAKLEAEMDTVLKDMDEFDVLSSTDEMYRLRESYLKKYDELIGNVDGRVLKDMDADSAEKLIADLHTNYKSSITKGEDGVEIKDAKAREELLRGLSEKHFDDGDILSRQLTDEQIDELMEVDKLAKEIAKADNKNFQHAIAYKSKTLGGLYEISRGNANSINKLIEDATTGSDVVVKKYLSTFNGFENKHLQAVRSHVAKTLKFKNVETLYKRKAEIEAELFGMGSGKKISKITEGGKKVAGRKKTLNSDPQVMKNELQEINFKIAKRKELIKKYYNGMSEDEFKALQKTESSTMLQTDYDDALKMDEGMDYKDPFEARSVRPGEANDYSSGRFKTGERMPLRNEELDSGIPKENDAFGKATSFDDADSSLNLHALDAVKQEEYMQLGKERDELISTIEAIMKRPPSKRPAKKLAKLGEKVGSLQTRIMDMESQLVKKDNPVKKEIEAKREFTSGKDYAIGRFRLFQANKMAKRGLPEGNAKAYAEILYRTQVPNIMHKRYPGKHFTDLTSKQLEGVFNEAVRLDATKQAGKQVDVKPDAKQIMRARQNIMKRQVERDEAMDAVVKPGSMISFKQGDDELTGTVTGKITSSDSVSTYEVRSGDKLINVKTSEITSHPSNVKHKDIRLVLREEEIIKDAIAKRDEFYEANKGTLDELYENYKPSKEFLKERSAVARGYIKRIKGREKTIEKLEIASREARETINKLIQEAPDAKTIIDDITSFKTTKTGMKKLDDSIADAEKRIKEFDDHLATDEALETLARAKYGDTAIEKMIADLNHEKGLDIALAERASSEQIANAVKVLRGHFTQAGLDEVKFGKLTKKQFEAGMEQYMPHVLTDDGKRYFDSIKELQEHRSAITDKYGYGIKFNPYGKSRTIDGKNIMEINKHFSETLKGKNIFSENISDIFIARMLKHSDLKYDNLYMENMMNTFGRTIKEGDTLEKGNKAVVNYGQLRKLLVKQARHTMALEMNAGRLGKRMYSEEERMVLFNEHFEKASEFFGFDAKILDEKATPMIELTSKQVAHLSKTGIAKQINEVIVNKANQARKLSIAKDESDALKLYDKFLHFIKLNQTTIMPSFHIRNKFSNMFQNWLGVGRDAFDPKMQRDAFQAVNSKGDTEKLRAIKPIVSPDGRVWHYDEIYNEVKSRGVIDEGFFAQDIGANAMSSGIGKSILNPKINPTDTGNFVPYRLGSKVGTAIENSDRLLHVASLLKQGKSIEEATESATKYLFDYSDLTAFEQSWMKRIFPYYTWMRKNARLQVGELIEQPEKYALLPKGENFFEGMVNEDEKVSERNVSDFARDWIQTPFSSTHTETLKDGTIKQRKEPWLLSPNLPFMDLGRIPDPTQPLDSARELLAQTAPAIKLPIELASNKNMFFDSEIAKTNSEGVEQNPIGSRVAHVASQLAGINAFNGATEDDGVNAGLSMLSTLTGIKMTAYDYEMSKRLMMAKEIEKFEKEDEEQGIRGE
jgi:hypothetical protein